MSGFKEGDIVRYKDNVVALNSGQWLRLHGPADVAEYRLFFSGETDALIHEYGTLILNTQQIMDIAKEHE